LPAQDVSVGTTATELRSAAMRRYYFEVGGEHPFRDETGSELKDEKAAWKEALLLTRDVESALQPGESWSLDISDQDGPLYRISIMSERLR